MGSWGVGVFENDTTADWAVALSHSTGHALIEETIGRMLELTGSGLKGSPAAGYER